VRLEGPDLYLRPYQPGDAEAQLDLVLRNRDFLHAFEPPRPDAHYTLAGQRELITIDRDRWASGVRFAFGVFTTSGEIIGRVALDNVVLGAWHNATVGYWIDRAHNGRGIGTRAVLLAVRFGFEEAALHRIQAGVMPRNVASARLLRKLGFRIEGRALHYLYIDGVWEDHDIYALTVEDWPTGPPALA
jgi:[ribosomal protein S5]-alanine N-acetyltransferase